MRITILGLLEILKRHPGATELIIKDVDDEEFAIADFAAEGNAVNIIIGKVVYPEEQQ